MAPVGNFIKGFTRLKGIFRSGINFGQYADIVSGAARKTVGHLPDDFWGALIKANPTHKKEAICGIQSVFDEAGKALAEINKHEAQAIMRTSMNKSSLQRVFKSFYKGEVKFWAHDALYAEREIESIIRAEESLLRGFKEFLPEVKNVVIKPLGTGNFGNTYKLEVIGENARRVFSEKVIKVYRDRPLEFKFNDKIQRLVESKSDEELLAICKEMQVKMKAGALSINLEQIAKFRAELPKKVQAMEELAKREIGKYHGPAAEANISEYLRYFSGHKVSAVKDGIEIPSFHSLGENPYSISNFIGKSTKASREFSFERLGLEHADFKVNPGNGINGICIDLGGVIPTTANASAVGSKELTRVLKRSGGKSCLGKSAFDKSLSAHFKNNHNFKPDSGLSKKINADKT